MRILVIPDLHGKSRWKYAVEQLTFDKVVFVGDYTDCFYHTNNDIIENLRNVVEFAMQTKSILLMGNHDLQYAYSAGPSDVNYRCSGYRPEIAFMLRHIFESNKSLFQVCYLEPNTKLLFSHAGISSKWWKSVSQQLIEQDWIADVDTIADILNKTNQTSNQYLLHVVGWSRGGSKPAGGLTWADKTETQSGIIKGYHQIVGHTPVPAIETCKKISGTLHTDRSITYTDCLDTVDQYLIINVNDDGSHEFEIHNI